MTLAIIGLVICLAIVIITNFSLRAQLKHVNAEADQLANKILSAKDVIAHLKNQLAVLNQKTDARTAADDKIIVTHEEEDVYKKGVLLAKQVLSIIASKKRPKLAPIKVACGEFLKEHYTK